MQVKKRQKSKLQISSTQFLERYSILNRLKLDLKTSEVSISAAIYVFCNFILLVEIFQTPRSKIAPAPPPPLQIPATPSSPGLSVWARRDVIRAPEAPKG